MLGSCKDKKHQNFLLNLICWGVLGGPWKWRDIWMDTYVRLQECFIELIYCINVCVCVCSCTFNILSNKTRRLHLLLQLTEVRLIYVFSEWWCFCLCRTSTRVIMSMQPSPSWADVFSHVWNSVRVVNRLHAPTCDTRGQDRVRQPLADMATFHWNAA